MDREETIPFLDLNNGPKPPQTQSPWMFRRRKKWPTSSGHVSNLQKGFFGAFCLSLFFLLWLINYRQPKAIDHMAETMSFPSLVPYQCHLSSQEPNHNVTTKREMKFPLRSQGRVLIVAKSIFSPTVKSISATLVANKIRYKTTLAGKHLPDLIRISKGNAKFGAIVFEDFRSFLEMDPWNRDLLDKYCRTFKVGITAMVSPEVESLVPENPEDFPSLKYVGKGKDLHFKTFPLKVKTVSECLDFTLNSTSVMLRMARGNGGQIESGHQFLEFEKNSRLLSVFELESDTFSPVAFAMSANSDMKHIFVVQDHGLLDSIPKVLFGSNLDHWITKILFLDALSSLSQGKIFIPLKRFVLIDIDDIFVGKVRLQPDDVQELITSQERLSELIPGFKYNLGFSGGLYQTGTEEENRADAILIENRNLFSWFPHMLKHLQPHLYSNVSSLENDMRLNRAFAINKEIQLSSESQKSSGGGGGIYAVAPHHSGVYPVHEELYEAWKKIWNVKVTSTEEYPHLRAARLRRGFVHRGIQVLPRQTCGLFTKNLFYDDYPGGPHVLERSVHGGELFQTFLFNTVNIFMTHMPNYCEDRLAPYVFESVLNKLKCWTNLEFVFIEPNQLGDLYFQMYPEEKSPIWGNPCNDHRHLEIWSEEKSCDKFPDFLILGPQKTGTTALYSFLKLHPKIRSNFPSPDTFEELQFFSGKNYEKGLDWYLNFFPSPVDDNNNETFYLFEKSATYFDHELAPIRARGLLQHSQFIVILISPVKRAYSWYQHMKSKNDSTALKYSFEEVISANLNSPKSLKTLRSRCLNPGKYAVHLERWLQFFKAKQFQILDGDQLVHDPVSVLNNLQNNLNIKPFVDFSNRIKFNKRKGFFCEVTNERSKCLGKGKGRIYPPMTSESQKMLAKYFRPFNEDLFKLLTKFEFVIPDWLKEELRETKDFENSLFPGVNSSSSTDYDF